MYFVKSLLLLSAVLCVLCNQRLQVNQDLEFENVAQAFEKILLEVFVPINYIIHVVVYNGASNRAVGLLHRMMTNYGSVMSFELEFCYGEINCAYISTDYKKAYVVILDEWSESTFNNENLKKRKLSIFYTPGATSEQYEEAFASRELRDKMLFNIFMLIDEGDFLHFKMLTYFAEDSCGEATLKTIDRFSKTSRRWKLPSFDLESHMKFHGCPLNLRIYARPPEVYWSEEGLDFNEFSGYFVDITKELAKRLNFTVEPLNSAEDDEERLPDIEVYGLPMFEKLKDFVGHQKTLLSINRDIYLLVPLGDFYTGLEKLFLPYDDMGWILVTITFSIGVIVIQIVNRLLKNSKSFVFGRRVTSPTMNLFAAFFGLGQTVLPGRNFARFILMLFIIWCLIIRTAYQGVLFEFLRSDGRKQYNPNLEDLVAQNAKVYYNEFAFYAMGNDTLKT